MAAAMEIAAAGGGADRRPGPLMSLANGNDAAATASDGEIGDGLLVSPTALRVGVVPESGLERTITLSNPSSRVLELGVHSSSDRVEVRPGQLASACGQRAGRARAR